MKYDYDIIVIGAGAAGLTAAKTAHGMGKRVALLEKTDHLGGECTWTGCIPSKALIKVSEVAWQAQHFDYYGLKGSEPSFDTSNVMPYVRAIVAQDYRSHTPDVIEGLGIDVLFGNAQFIDRTSIDLDGRTITFAKAIITTGSNPAIPPIPGLSEIDYLTNETFFDINELPESLLILGGGPIGCEMASALNRLGVHVQVVEMADRILPHEDTQVVHLLSEIMQKEGVTLHTSKKAMRVWQSDDGIELQLQDNAGTQETISAERLLIAVGRVPDLSSLNLDAVGVKHDATRIETNLKMQTTVSNIYAAGDCVGPYRFSHIAWYQAMTAARNAVIPFFKARVDYRAVDWVTFTAPELARMGLTEDEAREQYGSISVYEQPYAQLDRAITDRATQGIAKYIVTKKGQLVGAHILGARAGELLPELVMARMNGIPFYKIGSLIHAYPTYSELNWHAAKKAYVDLLENNFFVKLYTKIMGTKKEGR